MLLKCVGNKREHLVSERARIAWDEDYNIDETNFEIGNKYIAYGVVFRKGEDLPLYLVCDSEDDEYPVSEFAEHFEIINHEIPEGWLFTTSTSNWEGSVIMPERMVTEYLFMEKLYDGDPDAVQYFLKQKKMMKERYKDQL